MGRSGVEEDKQIICPKCGHDIFSRRCIEIDLVRITQEDGGGLNDDVLETDDSPVYEFHCKNCGHDCTNSFEA